MMRTAQAPDRPVTSAGDPIAAVLAGRLVQPLFQPIVDLSTRRPVGLEALARGPAGTDLEFPDRLFAAARAAGRAAELDMLCAERALEIAVPAAGPPPLLFINAEPASLGRELSPRMLELLLGGKPFRDVLEFTERSLPTGPAHLLRVAGLAQQWGNGIALDDVGVDPMSLAFLPILEPEVIKLDMSLIRDPHAAHTRHVCAVVAAEAARTGAVVVAEGIETEDDLRAAVELGAHWGQGWLFGRPGPIAAGHHFDAAAASRLRPSRPGFHQVAGTPFTIAAGHGPATSATAGAVAAEVARLRDTAADDRTAVVVATHLGGDQLGELAGRAGSVIVSDRPVPGEFAVAVLGPGHGRAVCVRSGDLVTVSDLPTVAAIARVLMRGRDD